MKTMDEVVRIVTEIVRLEVSKISQEEVAFYFVKIKENELSGKYYIPYYHQKIAKIKQEDITGEPDTFMCVACLYEVLLRRPLVEF